MHTVNQLLRASRWKLVLAVLIGAVGGLAIAGLIAVINTALATTRDELFTLGIYFLGLCLLVFVARSASDIILVRLSQQIISALRADLSRQILATPLHLLENHGTHRLLAMLTEDVTKIANFLVRLPTICVNAAVLVGCLGYLGFLSWQLLIAAVIFIALGILGFIKAQERAQGALKNSRIASDDLYKHFATLTNGIKELKLNDERCEAFLGECLDSTLENVARHHVRGMSIYAFAESGGMLIFFAFLGFLLFLPVSQLAVNPAVLTGYALTFLYLITPLEVLVSSAPDFGYFRVALEQISKLQLSLSTPALPNKNTKIAALKSLKFHSIQHSYRVDYDDGAFLLGPITLEFKAGEIVFLTGGNGSGKTTLSKLLVGLYEPNEGSIELNGQVISNADRPAFRQLFSTVFSDFQLFESLLGLPNDSALVAKVKVLLHSLKLENKVQFENGRFSTLALSQGQRKRLALLAAVLEDRPIYLFDEWAADQDPQFKRVFYTEILPELKSRGKLVLAVTHDDQYFHLADRHIKLESGRIVETRMFDVQIQSTPATAIA